VGLYCISLYISDSGEIVIDTDYTEYDKDTTIKQNDSGEFKFNSLWEHIFLKNLCTLRTKLAEENLLSIIKGKNSNCGENICFVKVLVEIQKFANLSIMCVP